MNATRKHRYLDLGSRGTTGRVQRRAYEPPVVGGRYDQFVKLMRIVLPSIAAILAAVTLAWPFLNPQETSFVLARERVDVSPERLRMERPRYYGTDHMGRPFLVQAQSALQEKGETEEVALAGIEAEITLDDGTELTATANRGVFYQSKRELHLVGAVEVTTDSGYLIEASDAALDLATHIVESDQPVTGVAPIGRFEALGFVANVDEDKVLFTGRVAMRITPNPPRDEGEAEQDAAASGHPGEPL